MYGNDSRTAEQQFLGVWKLISITQHDMVSGVTKPDEIYGEHPTGYLHYANGRMLVLITKNDRPNPATKLITAKEALPLMDTMLSYGGTYKVQGNKVIHHVDIAWNPSWVDSDQIRIYKFEKDLLILTTPPFLEPKTGKAVTYSLTWKKVS